MTPTTGFRTATALVALLRGGEMFIERPVSHPSPRVALVPTGARAA